MQKVLKTIINVEKFECAIQITPSHLTSSQLEKPLSISPTHSLSWNISTVRAEHTSQLFSYVNNTGFSQNHNDGQRASEGKRISTSKHSLKSTNEYSSEQIESIENDDENGDDYDSFGEFDGVQTKFGIKNSTVVTAQIGGNAYLPCTVYNIGNNVVSWIRRNNYHLLTVGTTTYIHDDRFIVTHRKHPEDWTLQIKYVQAKDAGWYECQISVHPPASIFISLNVIEAHAEIIGPPIRYLTPGSTLKLLCQIVHNTEASAFIFWYHNNRMINYDIDRGINVSTEAEYHYTELVIEHTKGEHSGNYTCVPSNAHPAHVFIQIFKGDNQAAMYHEDRSAAACSLILHRKFQYAIL